MKRTEAIKRLCTFERALKQRGATSRWSDHLEGGERGPSLKQALLAMKSSLEEDE
jgi:hypothetical protein